MIAGALSSVMRRQGEGSFQEMTGAGMYQFLFDATGYGYVLAWSISFYPQLLLNWQRKSTLGMSIGFQWYNLLGFFLYLIYTSFVPDATFQDQIFAAHALMITAFQLAQVPFYGVSKLSDFPKMHGQIVGGMLFVLDVFVLMNATGSLSWLSLLYACGYIKTAISLVKYTPQLYLNYQRKTTAGFAMGMIFLDLTGGLLSIGQQFVSCAYDTHSGSVRSQWNWEPLIGNKPKFLLGMIAIAYDLAFLYQHFVCYRPTALSTEIPPAVSASPLTNDSQPLDDGTPVAAMKTKTREHAS